MSFNYDELQRQLVERESKNLLRVRSTVNSPQGAVVNVDGGEYLNFCSNDYLGFANHPALNLAVKSTVDESGTGGGASHLICGHHQQHHLLEAEFAALTGRESALLFSTGFMANIGIITALCSKGDAVFQDKWNHASLIDGALMSGATFKRYLHNDMQSLERQLKASDARRKLICVDGVFSMDGDKAKLLEMVALANSYDALLMVDDAHGFGCMGENGLGLCEELGLTEADVPLLMCTLGKGLGSFGALVAGPKVLIDTLVQFSRSYIYTTSMPPAIAAATRASLKLLSSEPWRREQLAANIQLFQQGVRRIGLDLMPSDTAIQPIVIGEDALAMQCQNFLKEQGIWISAIRPPTVPKGTARLRITLTASHTTAHIHQLLDSLQLMSNQLLVWNANSINALDLTESKGK